MTACPEPVLVFNQPNNSIQKTKVIRRGEYDVHQISKVSARRNAKGCGSGARYICARTATVGAAALVPRGYREGAKSRDGRPPLFLGLGIL